MAASTTSHRPIKGILKKSTAGTSDLSTTVGTSSGSGQKLNKKSQEWVEKSMLATYHLADEDYSLLNIDEPHMPCHPHSVIGSTEDESNSDSEILETTDPEFLSQKLALAQGTEPKFLVRWGNTSEDEEDFKRQFELKRKLHYNEGLNIKFARQLISRDLVWDTEDEAPQGQEMQKEAYDKESTAAEAFLSKVTAENNVSCDDFVPSENLLS